MRAAAAAVDLGISFMPVPALTVSAAALHLGSELKYDRESAPLPTTLRCGAAYVVEAYGVTVAADVVKPWDGDLAVHAGAEERITLHKELAFSLRGGWHSKAPTGGARGMAAGVGIDWHPAGGFTDTEGYRKLGGVAPYAVSAVMVDYAWTPMGELGTAHWFSLALVF